MTVAHSVSDLVRDSKIETEWSGSCLRHIFYDTGPSAKQRRVRREERWVRQKYVGQGAYGRVYLEQCEHGSSQKLRAVKEIKKAVTLGEDLDYMRELEAVAKFSNQKYSHCFVRSYGWFELEDSIFISMEYLVNGDLQRYLKAPMKECEARQITSQVLEGLTFMHDNGFVHRDLKPGNIMVVSNDPEWFVKITDFGVSKRRQQDVTSLRTMQRGTAGFIAPEVLGVFSEQSYTFSVDMWSLGAVVYRILTNATAFQTFPELYEFSKGNMTFPVHALESVSASREAQDYILNLMKPDPGDRLTARSAAHHPWILDNSQNDSSSNGTESPVETTRFEDPVETKLTADSIASKAWSMDSDAVPTSSVESSSREAAITPSGEMETSVGLVANDIGCNDSDATIGPSVSEARERVEYEQPFIDDVAEDRDLRPKLSADTPFVLQTMRTADIPFVPETMKVSKPEESPVEGDPRVTMETDTTLRVETQDSEPLTSKTENAGKHSGDRVDEEVIENNTTTQEPSSNDHHIGTDQSRSTEVADETDPAPNGARETTSNVNTGAYSKQSGSARRPSFYGAVCNHCRTGLIFRDRAPEVSRDWTSEVNPCGHWLCNKCLIQHISLSLVSPGYMPPRCCTMPQGGLDIRSTRFDLDPEVTKAWEVLKQLQGRARGGFWTCSRGHRPSRGSLYVTKELPSVWNDMVTCDICLRKSSSLKTSYIDSGRVRKTHYCLYCRKPYGDRTCYCSDDINRTIRSFVNHPQVQEHFTEETSAIVQKAIDIRGRIEDLQPMEYISFDQMWDHLRFLEASDDDTTQAHDVDNRPMPTSPMDTLEAVGSDFNTWLLPQCLEFSANPPKDKKKCEAEHRRLSTTIMENFLLLLDEIDVGGDVEIRTRRKELVDQVQTVLDGIDQVCQKNR